MLALVCFAGCGARERQSLNKLRLLGLQSLNYEAAHREWPETIEDLRPTIDNFDDTLQNPVTGDNPGYEYVKPPEDWMDQNYQQMTLFYQLRDGKRDTSLDVCYVTGATGPYIEQTVTASEN